MTIAQALDHAKEQKPNPFLDSRLIGWLEELDGQIYDSLKTFQGLTESPPSYDGAAPENQQLLAPPPYDALYPAFLAARIDLAMEEYERYNISASVFNSSLETYLRHIARTRMPVEGARITYPRL